MAGFPDSRTPTREARRQPAMRVGVDVGSTTVKAVVVDPEDGAVLYSTYARHNADQAGFVLSTLEDIAGRFGERGLRVAVCGSAGAGIAQAIGAEFVQEVVANSIAVRATYPAARTAIELGGQDAKIVFFRWDERRDELVASDMRMNGSCAGGTGAFLDQVAALLSIDPGEFQSYSTRGARVYEISGRCGVFAKTDIQPLLNQGVSKSDIALSSLHAIAKQTIGGLAQGLTISPPVVFEGGPLTFIPRLVDVFRERLGLDADQAVVPERPETFVAFGAALALDSLFAGRENRFRMEGVRDGLDRYRHAQRDTAGASRRFFATPAERDAFAARLAAAERATAGPGRAAVLSFSPNWFTPGSRPAVHLGIDAGSTTTKFVLLDDAGGVAYRFYSSNHGDPLAVTIAALKSMRDEYRSRGVELDVRSVGTTGYGESLFAHALSADYHTVETVAHAEAARRYVPDVSFILDVGGQDMKAVWVSGGVVTSIVLNEACSAGCGSFIETYARSLGVEVGNIAERALRAEHPSKLGSRCTVFMNSSIITEQKNGRTVDDIMAGICRSIVENVFTKVLRVSNLDSLGERIVVQGGTFRNDAVLAAFEEYLGRPVIRPPFPGEMGAIGVALLARRHAAGSQALLARRQAVGSEARSSFIGLDALDTLEYRTRPGVVCSFCTNSCARTVVEFSSGPAFVTGNRCERGEVLGDAADPAVKRAVAQRHAALSAVPDLVRLTNARLAVSRAESPASPPPWVRALAERAGRSDSRYTIGLPRALDFMASLPYWKALFESLGFDVRVSPPSSYPLFESGLSGVPSDTICFPAKLVHGHVRALIDRGVDRVFMPMMVRMPKENLSACGSHVCSVVQGYPMIVAKSDEAVSGGRVPFDHPTFHWYDGRHRRVQTVEYLSTVLGVTRGPAQRAVDAGLAAQEMFQAEIAAEGGRVLESLEGTDRFAVVVSGRPYHADSLVNHDISRHFVRLGVPVLTLDSLTDLHRQDVSRVRMETTIPYHTRMVAAALYVARHPNLELVQIVSFGCGHDAVISDEMSRLLEETAGKQLLVLKLDEGEAHGPLAIRIRSFVETIRRKREGAPREVVEPSEPFHAKFARGDAARRVILGPNLSPAFSRLIAAVLGTAGYTVYPMPLADERAIELGKRYVHNDICYPAQINVGEVLSVLESGRFSPDEVAVGLAKNCEDCRAGQYAMLARKALDEAGYPTVPIVTTGTDTKGMHPGFRFRTSQQLLMIIGLFVVDTLEAIRRRLRPYEVNSGESDALFESHLPRIIDAVCRGLRPAVSALRSAVGDFNRVPLSGEPRRPRVGVIGEILLNYHPTANRDIERYLERNGMEVVIPPMIDFFRRSYVIDRDKALRGLAPRAFLSYLVSDLTDRVIEMIRVRVLPVVREFRLAERESSIHTLADAVRGMIDVSFIVGEGWLMPAEIMEMANRGVESFVIVNPFGCLPNHISGRGMIKPIRELYPDIQIVSLDFDPDMSSANIENRLQMLVMSAHAGRDRSARDVPV